MKIKIPIVIEIEVDDDLMGFGFDLGPVYEAMEQMILLSDDVKTVKIKEE